MSEYLDNNISSHKEEDENGYNKFGYGIYLILATICIHAYAQYSVYSGDFGCWGWAALCSLIPVVNAYWVFWGLVCYWKINWFIALAIIFLGFAGVVSKKTGNTCAIISAILFIICTWYTYPKTINKEQILNHIHSNLDKDNEHFMASFEAHELFKDDGLKFLENRIEKLKEYRVIAIRLGYHDLARKIRNNIKVDKELYEKFKSQPTSKLYNPSMQ